MAARLNIPNVPTPDIIERLKATCEQLEQVRILLGNALIVTSGYRSPRLNAAIAGATTSAHMQGYATDFLCPSFGTPLEVCTKIAMSGMKFDQLIFEYGQWTHISFDPRMREQILTITSPARGYQNGLPTQ